MTRRAPASRVRRAGTSSRSAVTVEVLVCGAPDRGDDGAAIAAMAFLGNRVPDDVQVRVIGELDIDDLLAIPTEAGVVIVDAAIGLRAGRVMELALGGLIGREDGPRPRSSHALAFPEVVGLADFMRGRPLRGRVVVIGGSAFGLGASLSAPVAAALPTLATAVLDAVEDVRAEVRTTDTTVSQASLASATSDVV